MIYLNEYRVWRVFENKGLICRFYVINNDTKAVQSRWSDYSTAVRVCNDLNRRKAA